MAVGEVEDGWAVELHLQAMSYRLAFFGDGLLDFEFVYLDLVAFVFAGVLDNEDATLFFVFNSTTILEYLTRNDFI